LFEAISERLPDVEKIRRNSGMHFLNLVLNKPGATVQLLSREFQYEK
jgi:hypothetical protein